MEKTSAAAQLALNRPDKANALSASLFDALLQSAYHAPFATLALAQGS